MYKSMQQRSWDGLKSSGKSDKSSANKARSVCRAQRHDCGRGFLPSSLTGWTWLQRPRRAVPPTAAHLGATAAMQRGPAACIAVSGTADLQKLCSDHGPCYLNITCTKISSSYLMDFNLFFLVTLTWIFGSFWSSNRHSVHRVIDRFMLEGTFKYYLVQPSQSQLGTSFPKCSLTLLQQAWTVTCTKPSDLCPARNEKQEVFQKTLKHIMTLLLFRWNCVPYSSWDYHVFTYFK